MPTQKLTKKKDYYSKAAEDAARKTAEEEAERERLAAVAAEEARLAASAKQAEDDAKWKKTPANILFATDEDKKNDLVAWLKSIPLSEACFDRIDRAFSNGAMVAEVINYFCPWICDKRHYFKWCSSKNKLSNWMDLNRKVFPKLGFRLNQRQISNIINPFACSKHQKDCEKGFFIYKLLFRIRDKLAEISPSVLEYRSPSFVPQSACSTEEKLLRAPKREFRNMLDYPCYSKIEILIANGYYDDEDSKKTTAQKPCSCCSNTDKDECDMYAMNFETLIGFKIYLTPFVCNSSPYFTFGESTNGTEVCIPSTFDVRGNLIRTITL